MISYYTFSVTAFLLLILFFAKSRSILSGNQNFVLRGVSVLDNPASKLFVSLSFRWKQISQTVRYIIFIVIPHRSEEAFKQMKGRAVHHYNKQKDTLMGKKEILNSSSASFFLKKMKEEKKNTKSGKIEETMEM